MVTGGRRPRHKIDIFIVKHKPKSHVSFSLANEELDLHYVSYKSTLAIGKS
jgi:hypothetical protein